MIILDATTRVLVPVPVITVKVLLPASWGVKTAVVIRPLVVGCPTKVASRSCTVKGDGIVPVPPQVICAVSR